MRTIPRADADATVAFVSVVELGGFREAARSLGMPRSTLSQRVQRLEQQLGVQLLVRSPRAVKLTTVGERYYRDVMPALRGLWQAESVIAETVAAPRGRLRITAPLEFGQTTLPDVLLLFAKRHPEVELVVELTDRVVNLLEEGYDIAIRIGSLPDSTSLTVRRLGKLCSMGVFASRDYLEQSGTPNAPEELRGHRCLTMGGHAEPNVWTFVVSGKQKRVAIPPCVNVNSFPVLALLAAGGLGIARLPRQHVGSGVGAELVEVLGEFAPRPLHCHALFQGGRNQPPAVRAFLDVLAERFSPTAWEQRAVQLLA